MRRCARRHHPRRRSVGLTAVVGKASAGALEYMPVARVANLVATIRDLKARGIWVFGTAADGDTTLTGAGPARPGRHRHRQRGQRHEPPCRRAAISRSLYSLKGHISSLECLDGRRRAAV